MSAPVDEPRCANCGALLSEDAAWCGQCFAPVADPTPEPDVEPVGAVPAMEAGSDPEGSTTLVAMWPCTACGGQNPIDLNECATCGTPFATLMRDAPDRPTVDPTDALVWSLVYPGLGHRKLGLVLDGFVRGILFSVALAMVILLAVGGVASGPTLGAFALFLVTGVIVYAATAYEAHRVAQGGAVLISARALLWVLVGVIVASVGLITLAVVRTPRR